MKLNILFTRKAIYTFFGVTIAYSHKFASDLLGALTSTLCRLERKPLTFVILTLTDNIFQLIYIF